MITPTRISNGGESNAAERSQFQLSFFQTVELKFIAVRQFPLEFVSLVRELFTFVWFPTVVQFPVILRVREQRGEGPPFAFIFQSQQYSGS